MRRTTHTVFFYVLFCVILLIGSCRQTPSPSTQQAEPTLRVGVSANAPPFVFRQGGSLTGLEPALAQKLGQYLNIKIELVEVPWEKQLEFLDQGKTDIIMSGMTITRARSSLVDFTKPYLRSGQIMLVRMEDLRKFSTGIESLMNTSYRIGTVADTVSDYFVTTAINDANEVVFKKSQDAVNALIANKIDAFVYDAPIVCYYAARHQQDKIIPILTMATEEYIGWAIRKGQPELLASINDFLDSLESQGALQEEIKYWIPYLYR